MKKIALILLIESFLIFSFAVAQETDLTKQDTIRPKTSWQITRFYLSVLPGFYVQNSQHGSIALAAPFGFNFRFYNKSDMGDTFFDLDFSTVPMAFNQDTYARFLKLSFGLGFTGKTANNQVHFGYLQNLGGYNNLFEAGYDLETLSVPLTLDILTPSFTSKSYSFLLVLKYLLVSCNMRSWDRLRRSA
jgi:hypothetical protein